MAIVRIAALGAAATLFAWWAPAPPNGGQGDGQRPTEWDEVPVDDPGGLGEPDGGDPRDQGPAPPERAFVVSVRLAGPAEARAAALDALAPAVAVPPLIDDPEVPGAPVGVVADRPAALRWLADHVFGESLGYAPELRRLDAPPPGGALFHDRGVVLTAAWITEVGGDGVPLESSWPSDRRAQIPEGTAWRSASLISSHAPLFAAPSPTLPPAHEAHGQARRRGVLFVLGEVDRCVSVPRRRCLRWLQVVTRDGDRFQAGYLPAFMVSVDRRWVRAEGGLPRAQLIPSAVDGERVTFILVARGLDGRLRRRAITAPMPGTRYPGHQVSVQGADAVVEIEGLPTMHLTVDRDLDDLETAPEDLETLP